MNDVATIADVTAVRGHFQAIAFAKLGGAAMSDLLASIATTKQAERQGPIHMFLFLDTHFNDNEQAAIPVVGSKKEEVGPGMAYDRYTAEVKTADGVKKIPGSVFTDIVKATDEGVRILNRIELLDAGQGENIPADIIALSTSQRLVQKKELRQRLADMRTALTKGAMLFHQVKAISDMNPAKVEVKMPFFNEIDPTTGDEVTKVVGTTIRLMDPSKVLEDELLNVGQIQQYNVAKAKAVDGGTITSLKATATRAPKKKPGAGTATAPTVPTTLEQIKNLFNVLATALDNGTEAGRMMEAKVLAECAKTNKEGDEMVHSVGTVAMAVDNVWNVIGNRFNAANAARAAALNTKPGKAA